VCVYNLGTLCVTCVCLVVPSVAAHLHFASPHIEPFHERKEKTTRCSFAEEQETPSRLISFLRSFDKSILFLSSAYFLVNVDGNARLFFSALTRILTERLFLLVRRSRNPRKRFREICGHPLAGLEK